MIPKILLLIKQIRPRTPQINNLRTPIPILFQSRALKAVERIRYSFTSTYDALVLIVAEGAFVADAREGRGPHVGVADGALAVAFVAEAADGDAGGLAAHDEVAGCDVSGIARLEDADVTLTDDGGTWLRYVWKSGDEAAQLQRDNAAKKAEGWIVC